MSREPMLLRAQEACLDYKKKKPDHKVRLFMITATRVGGFLNVLS